ncbi:hypothetical protein HDU76_007901 [Blyttiomyces sp. JEL0837]|nr:hypothetical protein HDU76_007901 [Blyttiomyces sp. JEL0837]
MADQEVSFSEKMEAHRLRQIEKDKIHNRVLLEGLQTGSIIGGATLLTSFAAQKFIPAYKSLRFPFKVFLVIAGFTGGFFTQTDVAAMKADREFAQKFSVTNPDELQLVSVPGANATRILTGGVDFEGMKRAFVKNRFEYLTIGYFSVLGGTLAYNFMRRDIFLSQKFINARMTAQVAAIAGVGIAAVMAASTQREVMIDPYYERVVNGPEKKK